MAQRGAWTPDKVRERIQTSMLTKRLTDHALGKCEMTQTQVTAALGLLRKSLPDLTSVEHSGELKHRDISDQPLSESEWSDRYNLETAAGPAEGAH